MILQSKVVAEVVTVKFNFASQLPATVSLIDATVEVVVLSGVDPAPEDMLFGDPTVSSLSITQQIYQGTGGVVYGLKCTAEDAAGKLYVIQHTLAVLSNEASFGPPEDMELVGTIPESACQDEEVYYALSIQGGYSPYGPVTISAGAMPDGWTIFVSGTQVIITGSSMDPIDTYDFTIHLVDFVGNVATRDVSINLISCIGGTLYVAQANRVGTVGFNVVDLNTFTVDHTIFTNYGARNPVFNPDGSVLYYMRQGGLYSMDPDTEIDTLIDGSVDENSVLMMNAAGTKLVALSFFPARMVIYTVPGYAVEADVTPPDNGTAMCWSLDESKIYIPAYSERGFHVYSTALQTFTSLGAWTHYHQSFGCVIDPTTGDLVIVTLDSHESPQIIRWSTNPALDPGHLNVLDIGNLTAMGSTLALVNGYFYAPSNNLGTNTLNILDSNLNLLTTLTVGYSPRRLVVNNARTRMYITNFQSDTVSEINLITNTVIGTVTVGDEPFGAAIRENS